MGTALARIQDVLVGERYDAARRKIWETFRALLHRPLGAVGLAIIVLFLFIAIFAPFIAGPVPQYSPPVNLGPRNSGPFPGFPLGTDQTGRSNFALLMYGARISLIVGLAASAVATVAGTLVGISAGYYGGFTDKSLSWFTNFFLVIPWLPFVLVVATLIREIPNEVLQIPPEERGFIGTIISISLVSWPTTARVVRAKVLSVKTLGYVQRARAIGAGDRHIMVRHIAPVLLPLIFANVILTVSSAIWTESFLAFFGLSDPSQPSWGSMIESSWRAGDFLIGRYWAFLPPGICITALVLAFTMLSRELEELLNPKLKQR